MSTASQLRKEVSEEPPIAQQIFEGLSQREVATILDLILLLKERRNRNEKPKTASKQPLKREAEDIELRLWMLVELIKSFLDLYESDDDQLCDHIEKWFKGLDYKPKDNIATLSFPAQTWDIFEGLSSEQWFTLTRLLSFLKEQDMLVKAKDIEAGR